MTAIPDVPFDQQCGQFWGYCRRSRGRHKCTGRVGHREPHYCLHCGEQLARGPGVAGDAL